MFLKCIKGGQNSTKTAAIKFLSLVKFSKFALFRKLKIFKFSWMECYGNDKIRLWTEDYL